MSRDYTQLPLTHVRRKDRAVTEEAWIVDLLRQAPFGTIALSLDGQPFVNSNIFVYDEARHAVYFHTAGEGRTRAVVERNPRACFSVSEMGRLLPADTALEMSVEYAGVSAFGAVAVIEDDEEAYPALQRLLDKYFPHLTPGVDYRAAVPEERKRTTVFRLDIEQWVGKRKAVGDFPGAFRYEELPALATR